MKFCVMALAMLAVTEHQLSARVGETYDELIARYGKPIHEEQSPASNHVGCVFRFQNLGIQAQLVNGRCVLETYRELESHTVSQDTIDLVLGANSRAKEWKSIQSLRWHGLEWRQGAWDAEKQSVLTSAWMLADGSLVAFLDQDRNGVRTLVILSREWNDSINAVEQRQREKKIKESGL